MNKRQVDKQIIPDMKNTTEVWWKEAVVYQIYPRSFKDSNNDGIGDLKGITSKLDYVKNLGIDVIWLNPIFTSPNDDNGYDISDYRNIMQEFGTMDDFNELLQEIHHRDLKLVLDLVVNHTSDEHPWFQEARKSRKNPYYSYYHWWPAEKGTPPLRRSYFDEEGNAWKYNAPTHSYYLHYFSQKQPDLNWENPDVRREIYDMMKFWSDKGIDGFRLDSIPLIAKDPAFPEIDLNKYPNIFEYYPHGPHLHHYLHEMYCEVFSHYDMMIVGEGSATHYKDVAKFVRPCREELNMLYGFGPSEIRNYTRPDAPTTGIPYSLRALKKMFTVWDKAVEDGWPAIYLGNHDQPRMVTRFGDDSPAYREVSAKMLTTFLLTMRGTPYWFAGDELGMINVKFDRISDYNDISTINQYKAIKKQGGDVKVYLEEQKQTSRDNARTPFPWDSTDYAGFSTHAPWLKVNPDYKKVNADEEEKNACSVLNYFKKTVALRKANQALIYGTYHLLDAEHPQIYTYTREGEEEKFLISLNFSPKPAHTYIPINLSQATVVQNNYEEKFFPVETGKISLRPFEAVVWKL